MGFASKKKEREIYTPGHNPILYLPARNIEFNASTTQVLFFPFILFFISFIKKNRCENYESLTIRCISSLKTQKYNTGQSSTSNGVSLSGHLYWSLVFLIHFHFVLFHINKRESWLLQRNAQMERKEDLWTFFSDEMTITFRDYAWSKSGVRVSHYSK